jgi:protein-S-isoprenylcysteine O-methyltransferase Ste14
VRKARAVLGTFGFLVLVPGVVAGLVPWWLTAWETGQPMARWAAVRAGGVLLIVIGIAVLLQAFARFAVDGLGTPAPVAPTEQLVVEGAYRYVRNPMYLAVAAIIVGQALVLGRLILLLYAAAFLFTVIAFVHLYEEPASRRRFGEQYEAYRRAVPAWWPRRRPCEADSDGRQS